MVRLEGVETKVNFNGNLHPNIKVGPPSRPRDPQRWAFTLDAPRPENGFSVHNNSLNNLLRGLNERVFYTDNCRTDPQQPKLDAFSSLVSFERDLRTCTLRPWSLEAFADSYTGGQYKRYKRAVDSLALMPLTKRDCRVSTFVKCEKINFAIKDDPAPRIIQPRNPRFNAAIGRFIKPLEKLVYKRLNRLYKYPSVAKGFNVYQTGDILKCKWEMFKQPCAVSLDASRFDQHVSVAALEWSHKIYSKFCDDLEFKSMLSMMLVNKGSASCKDGFVKYQVEGRRMSGDMDTALGNCLLMVAMTYSLCKTLGITHEVLDNGDDIVVIMSQEDETKFVDAVPGWFADLGFKMKIEPTVYELEHIEFCQMHPVFDGVEWRMVRNLVALAKDLVCTTGQTQVESWLRAIGDGGISLTAGLPVYQEFYSWLRKFGRKKSRAAKWTLFQSSGFFRLSQLVQRDPKPVTPQARESFHKAFGMPFSSQISLEEVYSQLSTGPLGINHTHFNCISEPNRHSPILYHGTKI